MQWNAKNLLLRQRKFLFKIFYFLNNSDIKSKIKNNNRDNVRNNEARSCN